MRYQVHAISFDGRVEQYLCTEELTPDEKHVAEMYFFMIYGADRPLKIAHEFEMEDPEAAQCYFISWARMQDEGYPGDMLSLRGCSALGGLSN